MATNIGTVLAVVAAKPATQSKSGFSALSFIDIEGTLSVPILGMTQASITSNLLKSGLTQHSHGTRTIGEKTIPFKEVSPDAGMTIVRANAGAEQECSFKITYASGRIGYFFGLIADLQENEATTETEAGGTFVIRPNSLYVDGQ